MKRFTLIELIVVIAVIGVLAGIVFPNISNIGKDASIVAIQSDRNSIETAIEIYQVDNHGQFPTMENPMVEIPQAIDFTLLYTRYLQSTPEVEGLKYCVDFTGKVWISSVDSPSNLEYGEGVITWNPSEGAEEYQVF